MQSYLKKFGPLLLLVFAGFFAAIRFSIPAHTPTSLDLYKTCVHLYMGGLTVLMWQKPRWSLEFWLFWGLSALEVAMAVVSRL